MAPSNLAPQQPIPSRSSSLAAAALMPGAKGAAKRRVPAGTARDRPDGRRGVLGDVPARGGGTSGRRNGPRARVLAGRAGRAALDTEETLQPFAEGLGSAARCGSCRCRAGAHTRCPRGRRARTRGNRGAIEMDLVARPASCPSRRDLMSRCVRGAVQLVAQEPVGRAARRTETAMDATAQDGVGLPACGRVLDEGGERRLHQRFPYIGPRLKIRRGRRRL